MSTPSATSILRYIDYFSGQENTAEEVRDFVQIAARFIDERRPLADWQADPVLSSFAEWYVESPHVGDGSGDAAIAIGEHAFRAGWDACVQAVHRQMNVSYPDNVAAKREAAWSSYDPPEDIKALS